MMDDTLYDTSGDALETRNMVCEQSLRNRGWTTEKLAVLPRYISSDGDVFYDYDIAIGMMTGWLSAELTVTEACGFDQWRPEVQCVKHQHANTSGRRMV